MTQSLKGRVVVVTCGSKAIGRGIAQVFAEAWAKVAIMARQADQAAQATAEIGHVAIGVAGDLTSAAGLKASYAAVAAKLGNNDLLCANTRIFPPAKLEDMTEAQWDEVADTNLKGTFLSVQAAIPYLKASDLGRIVITPSITGPVPAIRAGHITGPQRPGSCGICALHVLNLPSTASPSMP